MNIDKKLVKVSRIQKILDLILKLASGDLDARGELSGEEDQLDEIIVSLNMLAEELSSRLITLTLPEVEKRLDEFLETIYAMGALDFSKTLAIHKKGDVFDAIAIGLNSLNDELHASTVSREYVDSIIQSMNDMLIVLTPDTLIYMVNRATFELLGYSELEMIKMPMANITGENLSAEELIAKEFETIYLTKDGRRIPVSFSGSYMRDKSNNVQGIVCVAQDITLRKEQEQALTEAHRQLAEKASQLEEANRELNQYAYAVSHDIMAPLRAIQNYSDFLREDLGGILESEQQLYLDGLGTAVRQGKELVSDLLELSRLNTMPREHELIRMGPFLRDLVEGLDLPPEVSLEIADTWPPLKTQPVLLRQIFQNLILNGIKFNSSPEKRIELSWEAIDDNRYDFFVRDNGIGIHPDHMDQIFHLFKRLHSDEEYEGTGVGLAIVNKAVAKLNGSIFVESTPGKGSTFRIRLQSTEPYNNGDNQIPRREWRPK